MITHCLNINNRLKSIRISHPIFIRQKQYLSTKWDASPGPLVSESLNGRQRSYRLNAKGKLEWSWSYEKIFTGKPNENIRSEFLSWSPLQKGLGSIKATLRRMFLPIGYPSTVHPVYKPVHLWQFAETTIGSIVSVLCSQAMLSSVGVTPEPVTTGTTAVAINWVLKDTLGEALKLAFIQKFAHSFDSHPKGWKAFGEACSLTGAVLMLSTALVPSEYFLIFAGLGIGLRGIHYSIWGATHMTFTRNFAIGGNVGDLVAKDDTQMSLAHLVGTAIGVGLLTVSYSTPTLFLGFALLGPCHLYTTLALLKSTQFSILNQTTLPLLCEAYVRHQKVPKLKDLSSYVVGFGEWIQPGWQGPKLLIGASVRQAFSSQKTSDPTKVSFQTSVSIFGNGPYLIGWSPKKAKFYICLSNVATIEDVMEAVLLILHAHISLKEPLKSQSDVTAHLKYSQEWAKNEFPSFYQALQNEGSWDVGALFWGDRGIRSDWSACQVYMDGQR